MRLNWKTWLIVWLALGIGGGGVAWLLAAQGAATAGASVFWITQLLDAAWLMYGLFVWREVPWVRRVSALVIGTAAAALVAGFCWSMGWPSAAVAAAGAYAMAVTFFLGLLAIRLVLTPGWPVLGVARTLVDEAVRMKVALVFIVALTLVVPVLPLAMDPKELLRYRIQSFLSWSMIATGVLLGLMTIFLAVGTITSELNQRQIFLTMTKPVGRLQYLLGKWLGVVLLDLWLVAVCGGGIYVFTMMLAQQPGVSAQDAAAVRQQVLVAREAVAAQPPEGMNLAQVYAQRVAELRATDPEQFGRPDAPLEALPADARKQIQQTLLSQWHTIGPRQSQTYVFDGLTGVKAAGQSVQLRLEPKAASSTVDGYVYLNMRINGRPYFVPRLSEGTYHVLDVPAVYISDNGVMEVSILNAVAGGREQPSISFNTADGLQVLYRVGSFEANLLRSLAMMWLRLCFLAMLGLAAGTFLGFPTASLLSLMVYVAAASSGYLQESLASYAAFPGESLSAFDKIVWVPGQIASQIGAGEVWEAIKIVIRLIGQTFLALVPSFGAYNPTPRLAEGLLVSTRMLGGAALWVGVVWTGVVGLIGWAIFRRRELARVTV